MENTGKGTAVCLPTYNEAENIEQAVDSILHTIPECRILIVDDNSPDGTGNIANKISTSNPSISVLHRAKKNGLGRAYIDGFTEILSWNEINTIVQMDADGSHPADKLPELIAATEIHDLTIGSRYIPGGYTENWGVHRKFISRFGAFYAKLTLGLPINDPTGGFKCWRAELLRKVIGLGIDSTGYSFQVETSYIAHRLGAHIKEVPITFTDRNIGKSKMSLGIALEAFWKVPLLRFRRTS